MGIRRRKVNRTPIRQIITALVVSDEFVQKATNVLDIELIEERHLSIVAEWCTSYYEKYGTAIGRDIETRYQSWSEGETDDDLVDSVHDFLEGLSDEYDDDNPNVPYLLDELHRYSQRKLYLAHKEELEHSLDSDDLSAFERAANSFQAARTPDQAGIAPLRDRDALREAFEGTSEILFSMGGDADRFFGPALTRDGLLSIQAPEKTGKTWWMIEFAIRGLRARRKVAMFQVGDLSRKQFMARMGVRYSGFPLWERQLGTVPVPAVIEIDDEEEWGYSVATKDKKVRRVANASDAWEGMQRFKKGAGLAMNRDYFKLSVHANSTVNVREIASILDTWTAEGFIPDIIIIDYADILAPEDGSKQQRDQINDTWKALRRLAQERHALVITATQADAASYDQKIQSMRNFSEDKRKYAHVTATLGLNQTPAEKEFGGMRLNWIVLREAPFNPTRTLYVGTCYTLGRALCCSKF